MRATAETLRPSWFWPLAAIVVPVTSLFTKIRFHDEHKLPRTGAYVLAVNHHSEFDPLVVAVGIWRLGRAPRIMAKESLFKVPVLGAALRATGMIPVSRESSSAAAKKSLSVAEDLAKQGRVVMVYPEGTLTRDPELWPMRGKTGAARLAIEAGIPLIPAAQWGAQAIMPRYGKFKPFPLRKKTDIIFGDPVDLSAFTTESGHGTHLAEASAVVMDRIADLLGELRGEQPPAERWNPSAHQQKETGRYES